MANIQELMNRVFDESLRRESAGVYTAWVTPRGGATRTQEIRSTLDLPRVRLIVADEARRKFPQGFTFSVRPA